MALLSVSQPAATFGLPDWADPRNWVKVGVKGGEAVYERTVGVGKAVYEKTKDFLKDEVKGIAFLVWDVVTLDPKGAYKNFKDIAYNHVCGGLTVLSFVSAHGVNEHFDDCELPSHPIEPDILAKLSLYIKSDLNSVRIHESCKIGGRAAITFGEHIYFAPNQYRPRAARGISLLSHELTHVLQYRKKRFEDFMCEYGLNCQFGLNTSCAIEQQAYRYEDLVFEDQNEDGDGIFRPIDNCPGRYNPDQRDLDGAGVGDVCDEGWASDPPKPLGFRRYGDFNGDRKADILVQSGWGIGILTYDGSSLTSLMLAPNGASLGGWLYNSAVDDIVAIADFNRDFKDDILIKGPRGIGILSYDGSSLTSLMQAPDDTWFGGWRFSTANRIIGTADFNKDGREDIVITSGWGIGILTYDGSSLISLMLAPNGTRFGGWLFQASHNSIEGFGDFNADGQSDILIRSAWGIGILTLRDTTLTSLMLAPGGTKFGGWTFDARTDFIADIGNFNGGPDDEILILNSRGLAILGRLVSDASRLTTVSTASNRTRLGGWLLDTRTNSIFGIPGLSDIFKDQIMIRSAWGIGILTLKDSRLTPSILAPYGTRFGGWLHTPGDQILATGSFTHPLSNQILISSKWGIGILSPAAQSLQSLMLAPNGTRFGGWLFDSAANKVGIDSDVIYVDFRRSGY